MRNWLTQLWHGSVAALLPPACVLCGREARDASVCADCARHLLTNATACARCAQPLPLPTELCGSCLQRAPAFDRAWAGYLYQAPLSGLVQRFKFANGLAAGHALLPQWSADLRAHLAARTDPPPLAVIPVPLHRQRLRQRGYNQALELARGIGSALALPVLPAALQRTRATAAQPGLDKAERRRNVRRAFAAASEALPARVALIDDVMTTGATLDAAAQALKRAGVTWVEAWVLARRA